MDKFDLQKRLIRGHQGMFFETLDITPEIMHQLLSLNTHNRPVSRSTVKRYTLDMVAGNWPLTAEPVVIDRDGVMQNGQHRGFALIEAGVTVTMTVCWGAPPETYKVLDQGLKRTAAQVLALEGMTSAPTIAAAVRLILRYDTIPGLIWTGSNNEVGHANIIRFTEENREVLATSALTAASLRSAMPQMNGTTITAVAFLINRDSPMRDEADLFWEALKTGANLSPGDPCLALRNRELAGYPLQHSNSWRTQLRFGIWIKAWNAYVEGRKINILRFSRQELPMPKVL